MRVIVRSLAMAGAVLAAGLGAGAPSQAQDGAQRKQASATPAPQDQPQTASGAPAASPPAAAAPAPTADAAKPAASPASPPSDASSQAKPAQAADAAPVAKPVEPAADAATPAATPAAVPAPATTSPAQPAAEAKAAQPAPAVVDPIIAAVRAKLEQPAKGASDADRAALAKVYAARTAPIWVSPSGGLNKNGRKAAAEIRNADDWGLSAAAFVLPKLDAGAASPAALADAEVTLSLAVAKYAFHARGGRIADPSKLTKFFDQKPAPYETSDLITQIAESDAPDAYLRKLHPKHPQFERLRQALLKARGAPAGGEAREKRKVPLPDGLDLRPGQRHKDVALLRARLDARQNGDDGVYDDALVEAVREFQKEHGLRPDGHVGPATVRALNGGHAEKSAGRPLAQRLIVNMERWRWVPDEMGSFHVWDNIPEFQVRVLKSGKVVHQEKIIVGKVDTQTPLFSADMKYVIFHPDWGVPDSIKVKEILPYLRRNSGFFGSETDTRVLKRHNLRVSQNGRTVDASQIDWSTVDIRRYQFIQPGGGQNVLGVVKFRFPNKHDVYMHDTPQRELFAKSVRTFSHGCMRVHNPRRLAEVLLAEDKGWSPEKVGQMLAGGQSEVTLGKRIPVHVTYFTAMVDEHGKLDTFADVYGHDNRVAMALEGKPIEQIAASDPALLAEKSSRRERVARRQPEQPYNSMANFFNGLFGN